MRVQRYEVTVCDGDITIHCKDQLEYATLWGAYGIQHNFKQDSKEDEELRRRLSIVAQEMLEVDKIIQKGENNG